MLVLLTSPADSDVLKKVAQDLDGYVKFIVDVSQKIMTAGGLRHLEGEQLLLSQGSRQEDLWGGGGIVKPAGLILSPWSISARVKITPVVKSLTPSFVIKSNNWLLNI